MIGNVWLRSTRCTASECVEVFWKRSSRCESGHCAEVRRDGDRVLVRNSCDPDGPVLEYADHDWRIELAVIRRNDLPVDAALDTMTGVYEWRYMGRSVRFTRDEMDAFVAGVLAGEFDLEPADA